MNVLIIPRCLPRSPLLKAGLSPERCGQTQNTSRPRNRPHPQLVRPVVTFPEDLGHCVVPLQRSNVLGVYFAINPPDREHLEGKTVSTHARVARKGRQKI